MSTLRPFLCQDHNNLKTTPILIFNEFRKQITEKRSKEQNSVVNNMCADYTELSFHADDIGLFLFRNFLFPTGPVRVDSVVNHSAETQLPDF